MDTRKIIFVLSQENSLSFCSECLFQLEPNVGCSVFLPSKSVYCLDCYLTIKKRITFFKLSEISIICSSEFYKLYHCFLNEFGVWKPEEELAFLEAVEKHGYGNWEDITYVNSKAPSVYESHYLKFYVDQPFIFELDEFAKIKSSVRKPLSFYYNSCDATSASSSSSNFTPSSEFDMKKEPMDWHCPLDSKTFDKPSNHDTFNHSKSKHEHCNCPDELKLSSTKSQAKLAPLASSTGYCGARDDFNIYPFDNAELSLSIMNDLSDCTVPDLPVSKLSMINDSNLLLNCLSYALIQNYNHVLKRRERMKKFVKEYHLLYNQNAFSWLKQYQITLNKDIVSHISRMLQFIPKSDAKGILSNLKQIDDLRAKLQDLKYYRIKGLQTFKEVELYKELKLDKKKRFAKALENIAAIKKDQFNLKDHLIQLNFKRSSGRLDIEILPGYDKLLEDEKQLCASARIIPTSYTQFKALMIAECQRTNGLRLAQARKLMKICVNRTRKIYDHLLEKGSIWLPSS